MLDVNFLSDGKRTIALWPKEILLLSAQEAFDFRLHRDIAYVSPEVFDRLYTKHLQPKLCDIIDPHIYPPRSIMTD